MPAAAPAVACMLQIHCPQGPGIAPAPISLLSNPVLSR